jgi:formylmethanofuran dehydrogenase subunit E
MPKLSYKEKCNLYEKIRMDDQERKEWEENLEVKITPTSKRRIECFDEIVKFIENDSLRERTINEHSGIYHLPEINKTIKKLNQKVERKAICVKCGQWTLRKYAKTKNKLTYCAYCYEVCFGTRAKPYGSVLSYGEKLPPGFQRLR